MKFRSVLLVASLTLAACGGTNSDTGTGTARSDTSSISRMPTTSTIHSSTTAAPTTVTPVDSTSSTPTTELYIPTPPPVFADIPADYQPPSGWIRIEDDTDDLRLDAFAFRQEGCCEAGLDTDFGSPELPATGLWSDIANGFYYATFTGWDPLRPDVVQMKIGRIVECSSPEASELYYCNGERGRFEYLPPFLPFEVPLGDFLTVKMVTYVEPTPEQFEDGFSLNSTSFLGQGPDFQALLSALYEDYIAYFIEPTAEGATLTDIDRSLENSPFRYVGAWNAVWERPTFPPFSYAGRYDPENRFQAIPTCYDEGETKNCLPNVSGDPDGSPATFESLIVNSGSVHVRNGRWAIFYPGVYTAGG